MNAKYIYANLSKHEEERARKEKVVMVGGIVRDTTTTRGKNIYIFSLKSPIFKVLRQCPFVLLVEVKGKFVLVHNSLSTLT